MKMMQKIWVLRERRSGRAGARRGFTILELLVVISIMAIIATLATGAAMKAIKQSRSKRVDATLRALEVALGAYRAQEGKWPVDFTQYAHASGFDPKYPETKIYWVHGADNKEVFKYLYPKYNGNTITYIDPSALLTLVNNSRQPLRQAIEKGNFDVPVGYMHPDHTERFEYFCIRYSELTDSVKVYRQDTQHDGSWCPALRTEWRN